MELSNRYHWVCVCVSGGIGAHILSLHISVVGMLRRFMSDIFGGFSNEWLRCLPASPFRVSGVLMVQQRVVYSMV